MFRVTGAYETRTKIEIVLPYTDTGDPAFTPEGEPIKGADPVTIALPLFNYMPIAELKQLMKATAEIDDRELTDDYNMFDRQRDSILESLRPFITADQYAAAERLTIGELVDINREWTQRSAAPLGESSASNGSSTTTRRPSKQTSSGSATASAT